VSLDHFALVMKAGEHMIRSLEGTEFTPFQSTCWLGSGDVPPQCGAEGAGRGLREVSFVQDKELVFGIRLTGTRCMVQDRMAIIERFAAQRRPA